MPNLAFVTRPARLPQDLPASVDRTGRVLVERDCSLPGHPEFFCIGDAAAFHPVIGRAPLPGVSPVAMQEGRFVARQVRRRMDGRPTASCLVVDAFEIARGLVLVRRRFLATKVQLPAQIVAQLAASFGRQKQSYASANQQADAEGAHGHEQPIGERVLALKAKRAEEVVPV